MYRGASTWVLLRDMGASVEQELNAPFVLVGEHGLDQLVRLVNDPVVTHLCE